MKRLILLSCLVLSACGGSKTTPEEVFDFAGLDGTPAPKSDLAHVDGAQSPDAPVITLVSPATAVTITSSSLPLTVHVVSPLAKAVAAVTASLDGSTTPTALSATGTTGDWTAPVDLSGATSGPHELVVTATDAAGLSGTLTLSYTVDHGPNIVFISPTVATAKGNILVKLTVDDPLNGNADVVVTASVRNTNVPLMKIASTTPPEFDGTITFSAYTPPLNGAQLITVTAKNTKTGAVSMKAQPFTVDEQGPTIVIQNPAKDLLASGVIMVQAIVTDDVSGVDDSSVFAVFGGDATKFTVPLKADPDLKTHLYTGIFDIGSLGTSTYVTPSVAVTALDKIANSTTVSEQIIIDNVPPVLSLDPPKVRIVRSDATYNTLCTVAFDPLGDEALNDNAPTSTAAQLLNVRAQIEDRGNTASGQTVVHVSGIDPSTVVLYAISAAAGGTPILAVDSDNDKNHTCDSINPKLTPVVTGTQASLTQFFSLPMVPLTAVGTPDYGPTDGTTPPGCGHVGGAQASPPLCSAASTMLTYALQYLTVATPAIWSLSPVKSTTDGCVGAQFDTLSALPEGSACLVVAGKDYAGNRSVSAPLRTCIRKMSMPPGQHVCDSWVPSDCTGTFDPKTSTVSSTPCNPLTFPSGQLRIQ